MEILRRIDRQVLTAALLARQTGLQQSHISNFLHSKRRLSLPALDRVLAAQRLSVQDLVAFEDEPALAPAPLQDSIPLVSQASAINDYLIPPGAVSEMIRLPTVTLSQLQPREAAKRRQWQRFVAIGVTPTQADAMHPVLLPNMIVVLDRHYSSLKPSREDAMDIFAVKVERTLYLRYVTFDLNLASPPPRAPHSPYRSRSPAVTE